MCDCYTKCYIFIKKERCEPQIKPTSSQASPQPPTTGGGSATNPLPDDPNTEIDESIPHQLTIFESGLDDNNNDLIDGATDPHYFVTARSSQALPVNETLVRVVSSGHNHIESTTKYYSNEVVCIETKFLGKNLTGLTLTYDSPVYLVDDKEWEFESSSLNDRSTISKIHTLKTNNSLKLFFKNISGRGNKLKIAIYYP